MSKPQERICVLQKHMILAVIGTIYGNDDDDDDDDD
jgi:hypothetical protein